MSAVVGPDVDHFGFSWWWGIPGTAALQAVNVASLGWYSFSLMELGGWVQPLIKLTLIGLLLCCSDF